MKRACLGLIAVSLVSCGWLGGDAKPRQRAAADRDAPAPITAKGNGAPRTVILAVVDTLRADHTSLCGYDRPTTPVLDAIAKRPGVVHTCDAYSAAPWTHPSHASMFTGKPVTEHAAIWVTDSEIAINPVTRVRPLADTFTTLAEEYQARGYQTVAVTANMIITPESGLLQGFDRIEVTPSSLGLRGRKLRPKLREVIDHLDPDKPLFLFLNLYDAHDPYPPIPADVGWVPPQERVDLHPNEHDETQPYVRFVKGLATEAESEPFLTSVRNGYDWGVHSADHNLGVAFQLLEKAGWLGDDVRIAITADHGEALGEHRLLRHGGYLVEPMVNVPLVLIAPGDPVPVLPSPVSNVVVHDWLLTGKLPTLPVVASSEKNDRDVLVGRIEGAVWGGSDKLLCRGADRLLVDLAGDPGELNELAAPAGHPLTPTLDVVCEGIERLHQLPAPKRDDEKQRAALRAVGYVE